LRAMRDEPGAAAVSSLHELPGYLRVHTRDSTPPSYLELMQLAPRLEKALGVWMVPTLGFEIRPHPPGYEFPILKRVFDEYRPVMQAYADEIRDYIFSPKLESVPQDEVDEITPFWGNARISIRAMPD
jgi:hypothetical protein